MELSLIGLQNAGKTSLVNVLTTGSFQEDMIPTVGFNMRKVTKGGVVIKLWDLGGQVRRRHAAPEVPVFCAASAGREHRLQWDMQPRVDCCPKPQPNRPPTSTGACNACRLPPALH